MIQADEAEYHKIIDKINKLKKISIFKSDETNPYLNLGKPTIENIKRLDFLDSNNIKFKFALNIFFCIPKLVYDSCYNLLHHVKYIKDYSYINPLDQSINFLFVSHYIGQDNTGIENDIFYGSMPLDTQNNLDKNFLVYIDHTKNKIVKHKNPNSNIIAKTCDTRTRLKLIISNFTKSLVYLKKMLTSLFLNFEKANCYLQLAMIQTKLPSASNEILAHNLSRYIIKYKPNKIVITLEGHPYEIFLAKYLSEKFKNLEIIFWQLAPVVPSQHGFLENIASFGSNSKIGVTGKAIKTYIESNVKKSPKIYVVGSPKFKFNKYEINNDNCILFAPEGTKDAVYEFLDLIPKICEVLSEHKIVLRLHPSVVNLKNSKILRKYEKFSNFELSSNSLADDLERAKYCIYRSSSVGIESLNYGVQPIHFSIFNNGELNPLFLSDPVCFQAKNSTELLQILVEGKKNNLNELQKAYGDYFEPMNVNRFLSIST